MPLNTTAPLALTEDILNTHILGYSVLQIGVAAGVIGLGIWGIRSAFSKALGNS